MTALFPTARRARWTGTRAIVQQHECPNCGAPYTHDAWTQLPLLRHAGYGEARRTTTITCRCRRASIRQESVNPRPLLVP